MIVPFVSFFEMHKEIRENLIDDFKQVLDSNWFIGGEENKKFEQSFADYQKRRYCIGCGNGLDAIMLSLKALGITKGDEVIIPSNTFIATALAVSYTGAIPVFVEPRIDTYNINPELIEEKITEKTKAIVVVHLYGQPAEMDSICEIAERYLNEIKKSEILLPKVIENVEPVWHIFAVRCKDRDKLELFLNEQGIGTNKHYPIPLHLQKAYEKLNISKGTYPIAEEISETELSIPMYYGMSNDEIRYVIDALNQF